MIETSHPEDRAGVAELGTLAFGPGIQVAQVHHDLAFGVRVRRARDPWAAAPDLRS